MKKNAKGLLSINILKHPAVILFAIALGILIGLRAKTVANLIAPIGEIYLIFIQMSIIPILVTAIISSLASLIRSKAASGSVGRLALLLLLAITFMALAGIVTGIVGRPGAGLDEKARSVLGAQVTQGKSGVLEMTLADTGKDVAVKQTTMVDFLKSLIPSNIFNSLSFGRTLELVFFSIIFGIVLGFIRQDAATQLIGFTKSLLEAFQKLVFWAMYALPFGLVCLIAKQIADVGIEVFNAMLKFIFLFWLGGFAVFVAATIVIWVRSGLRNPLRVLKAMFDPIMISLATRQSLAALPSAIDSLERKLGFDGAVVNLTLPLGTTIGRFGNVFYFALASFFVVQLYGAELSAQSYVLIVVGSIFAGVATAGSSGVLTLSMIGIILKPLGLPIEAVLVVLMAIDSIVDPMRTFLIVYVNMMVTSLVAKRTEPEALLEHPASAPAEQARKADIAARSAGDEPAKGTQEGPGILAGAPPEVRPFVAAFLSNDTPPYLFTDKNGEMRGIELDLAREIARRENRPFVVDRDSSTREELLERLAKGTADVAFARFTKPEYHESRAAFSDPYLSISVRGTRELICLAVSRAEKTELARLNACLRELLKEGFTAALVKKNREMR